MSGAEHGRYSDADLGAPRSGLEPVGPPTGWLVLSVVALTLALAAAPFGMLTLHWLGYGLSTFVAVAAVARFRAVAQQRRQNPLYTPKPGVRRVATALLVAAFLVSLIHAWVLATHYAS